MAESCPRGDTAAREEYEKGSDGSLRGGICDSTHHYWVGR